MKNINPTQTTYNSFDAAYEFFNQKLFNGTLPNCLITMQRKNGARGYFSGDRFGSKDSDHVTDEIALNPVHFRSRTPEDIMSVLAHEMAHLWQHHFGARSRGGYHNKQWAEKMREIGLIPSHTGQQGGRETGQRMSHYIEPNGRFQRAFIEFANGRADDFYFDRRDDRGGKQRQAKAASKTRFTCPCCSQNAWAKSSARLMCGECEAAMEAA